MSILFATPCYGGMLTLPYFNSCMELHEELNRAGLEHTWLTTANESLIVRARNTMASTFLKSDYEYMMFLDADIGFSPEDVSKLWNLQVPVAVGAYPMKRKDAPLSAWKDGKLLDISPLGPIKPDDSPFPVDYAGTGFMLIHRDVFERLKSEVVEYEEGHVGQCWGFFDLMYKDGISLSEDYAFCQRYRDIGGEIVLDPSIKLSHTGTFTYGE